MLDLATVPHNHSEILCQCQVSQQWDTQHRSPVILIVKDTPVVNQIQIRGIRRLPNQVIHKHLKLATLNLSQGMLRLSQVIPRLNQDILQLNQAIPQLNLPTRKLSQDIPSQLKLGIPKPHKLATRHPLTLATPRLGTRRLVRDIRAILPTISHTPKVARHTVCHPRQIVCLRYVELRLTHSALIHVLRY